MYQLSFTNSSVPLPASPSGDADGEAACEAGSVGAGLPLGLEPPSSFELQPTTINIAAIIADVPVTSHFDAFFFLRLTWNASLSLVLNL
ncbi:hypothetical protein [Paenibacillus luteus]|uniref:hypothetical protein n=1 Tax=Paenibacillus luteus TaxID=2545753 RepID=UPI0019D55776|nr:hypothetical protein [Paenibacillus luteus]